MKYFRMSYEEVVFKRSYINIIMLNRAIPSFKVDDKDDVNNDVKNNKRRRNNKAKEFHEINEAMHANDFFMDLM